MALRMCGGGMVPQEVPIMKTWFYITYEKDPVLCIYHLMDDYIEGNLHIMSGSMDEWSGVVLNKLSTRNTWFYVTYEKDPVL